MTLTGKMFFLFTFVSVPLQNYISHNSQLIPQFLYKKFIDWLAKFCYREFRVKKMFSEDYVVVNSVPTHIITIGKWITDEFESDKTHELVLVIPGNPGYPYLYKKFCQTIHDELETHPSVWVVGHAGKIRYYIFQ